MLRTFAPVAALTAALVASVPAAAPAQEWRAAPTSWDQGRGSYVSAVGWRGGRSYQRGNRNHYAGRQRCYDKGRGGLAIGGIAGGLLGSQIAGRGNSTLGAILGAGVGALAGQAIDKSDGRPCYR